MFQIHLSREWVISSVLSHHSKNLKWWTDRYYSSVLSGKQMKIYLWGMRMGQPKSSKEKRSPRFNIGYSFYVFFSPLEPVLCKLGYPGRLFVLPEVLTPQVLRSSFVLFSRAFLFFVFQSPPFWTPFSYSNIIKFNSFQKCIRIYEELLIQIFLSYTCTSILDITLCVR